MGRIDTVVPSWYDKCTCHQFHIEKLVVMGDDGSFISQKHFDFLGVWVLLHAVYIDLYTEEQR